MVHRCSHGLLDWVGGACVHLLVRRSAACETRPFTHWTPGYPKTSRRWALSVKPKGQGLARRGTCGYCGLLRTFKSDERGQVVLCALKGPGVGGVPEKLPNGADLLRVLSGSLAARESPLHGNAGQAASRDSIVGLRTAPGVVIAGRFNPRQRGVQRGSGCWGHILEHGNRWRPRTDYRLQKTGPCRTDL